MSILESRKDIDVILTDVSMPQGMSGLELARRARSLQPNLPVLLTSGYAETLRRDDHGFPLLPKPYTATDLAKRLRAILDERG